MTNEEVEKPKGELQSVNGQRNSAHRELAASVDELHHSQSDLRNLLESTQLAALFLDRRMVIRNFTPAAGAVFTLSASDRGRSISDIAHELEDVDLSGDIKRVLDERQPLERSVRQRGGKLRHVMRIRPYRTVDQDVDGVLITLSDVTELAAAEEQQRVLVSELNHRVRNMLQVVISLCNQTLHRSQDLKSFEAAFMGRMQALARAYELLSRVAWRRVPVGELVRTQMAVFATEGRRYTATGDDVELEPHAALPLGLVLYELGANATKHGALSSPHGRVALSWRVQQREGQARELQLHWVESGGPEVKQPERTGFGSELITRQLQHELGGGAKLAFEREGVQVWLTLPLRDGANAYEAKL